MLCELAVSTYYHILLYIGLGVDSTNQSLKIFLRLNNAGRLVIGILLVCKLPNSVYEKSPSTRFWLGPGTKSSRFLMINCWWCMMNTVELTTPGYILYVSAVYHFLLFCWHKLISWFTQWNSLFHWFTIDK